MRFVLIVAFNIGVVIGQVACTNAPAEREESASSTQYIGESATCSMTENEARARGLAVHELALGEVGIANPAPNGLVLFNRTGMHLQLDSVSALPSPTWISSGARDRWAEYCVHLDDFSVTGQPRIGVGEIGCQYKLSTEDGYAPLRWGTDAQPTGLSVAPGSCVFVGGGAGYDFRVKTRRETQGLFSVRQPIIDHVFDCSGEPQYTPWRAWKNESAKSLTLVGATIYAASPEDEAIGGTNVVGACVKVFDENDQERARYCSPDFALATRGVITLPQTVIPPGWSIGAQATNTCAPPASRHWGWAAWLHVY
jgi:hypothetical protein